MINQQKIDWLLQYALELNRQFKSVSSKEKDDYSEDRIKIFFHKERLSHFLKGHDEKIIPITFEIWPSLSCNARCPFCTYSLNNAREEADKSQEIFLADTENYKKILFQFKEAGVNSIILTGGGEPLINPRLVEITNHIKKLDLSWGMFTNGMLLNEGNINDLLSFSPRFIRISINAGSALSHKREYRIGMHTYELVKNNAIVAATISHQYKKSIGLGYAVNGKITNEELLGMQNFITEIMERSKGGLASVSFRPKVVYYNTKGEPSIQQPHAKSLPDLIEKIDELIVSPLQARFKNELKIDFKKGMFRRLYNGAMPTNSIATGWTGSIDEKGSAYVISELNGSTWSDSELGNFEANGFSDVWQSHTRNSIVEKYAKGEILAPTHHKLSHIDEALKEIRVHIGLMSEQEINLFFELLEKEQLTKPKNWDFL